MKPFEKSIFLNKGLKELECNNKYLSIFTSFFDKQWTEEIEKEVSYTGKPQKN